MEGTGSTTDGTQKKNFDVISRCSAAWSDGVATGGTTGILPKVGLANGKNRILLQHLEWE